MPLLCIHHGNWGQGDSPGPLPLAQWGTEGRHPSSMQVKAPPGREVPGHAPDLSLHLPLSWSLSPAPPPHFPCVWRMTQLATRSAGDASCARATPGIFAPHAAEEPLSLHGLLPKSCTPGQLVLDNSQSSWPTAHRRTHIWAAGGLGLSASPYAGSEARGGGSGGLGLCLLPQDREPHILQATLNLLDAPLSPESPGECAEAAPR